MKSKLPFIWKIGQKFRVLRVPKVSMFEQPCQVSLSAGQLFSIIVIDIAQYSTLRSIYQFHIPFTFTIQRIDSFKRFKFRYIPNSYSAEVLHRDTFQ